VRFSRLIEETSVDAAVAQLAAAQQAGFAGAWLADEGVIDGSPSVADPRLVAGAAGADRQIDLVLLLDAGRDTSSPPGQGIELGVSAGDGWQNALSAVLSDSPREPDPALWVYGSSVSTFATAGRRAIGLLAPAFDEPEKLEERAAEYLAELESDSAVGFGATLNPRIAVLLDAGDDADELVGLVERYRQAGADEVVLSGAKAADADFVRAVIGEFDDAEVRSESETKAASLAPALEAAAGRRAGKQKQPKPPRPPRKPSRRRDLMRGMQKYAERSVRRMSDKQLGIVVGNRAGVRMLFNSMAARYRPAKAGGFEGPIEFTLETPHGPEVWTIDCGAEGASSPTSCASAWGRSKRRPP
jgi:hypothetical protein